MECSTQCRNILKAQHLAPRTAAVYCLAAGPPHSLEWKVELMLFCLLGQRASRDTAASFNVLDSDYYDIQHNISLRAELKCGILN